MPEAHPAAAHLHAADPVLRAVIDAVGPPALRRDPPEPFRALTRAIMYQQLSGKAARTIHERFLAIFGHAPEEPGFPSPPEVLGLDDEAFRAAGVSRQKVAAIRDLAQHVAAGELDEQELSQLPDDEVIARLTRVRGVGRWTAEMYLIFNLGRPDVLPVNDLGINRAIMQLYGLEGMPGPDEVRRIGAPWSPWSSVACWYLWRSTDVVLLTDGPKGRASTARARGAR